MKKIITKIQFRIASWLFTNGIVAPQILESNSTITLPNGYTEEDLKLYNQKQNEIKEKNIEVGKRM